ncbi:MAG: hypothetical protein HOP31_01260 [Ignavibacteria bacterium]|nr:hypothetical protein [Ignavibacteria bacterium]
MMATRILHCGNSIINYDICIEQKIAGFTTGGPSSGDLIYLVVKVKKKSLCGARFVLDEITDYKPWPDSERYFLSFTVKNIEYCEPFDVSILAGPGGPHWGPKYMQSSKPIKEADAVELLENTFRQKHVEHFHRFEDVENQTEIKEDERVSEEITEFTNAIKENPELEVKIMGTFQTINFTNEMDVIRGLEKLVNDNFHSLFQQFPENRSILIPENRLFMTQGIKNEDIYVSGIRGIPDALLIIFTKSLSNPLQINLIEYECYGETRTRASEKSNYLNTQIIPQLMRFASVFSIITDQNTRETTIKKWIEKILIYINKDSKLEAKLTEWIRELNPKIKEKSIDREIEKLLETSFKTNLRIMLIIDELTTEQKVTIKNVINSFKLGNDSSIGFEGYVIKLIQKLKINEMLAEYALTVQ